jgi:hypothetical protein
MYFEGMHVALTSSRYRRGVHPCPPTLILHLRCIQRRGSAGSSLCRDMQESENKEALIMLLEKPEEKGTHRRIAYYPRTCARDIAGTRIVMGAFGHVHETIETYENAEQSKVESMVPPVVASKYSVRSRLMV